MEEPRFDNIGGLNTFHSPLSMDVKDSPFLMNVDLDESGTITSRRGTKVLASSLEKTMDGFGFAANNGEHFVVCREGLDLVLYRPDSDTWTKLNTWFRMFPNPTESQQYVWLPGEKPSVLILAASHRPIEVRVWDETTGASNEFIHNLVYFAPSVWSYATSYLGASYYFPTIRNPLTQHQIVPQTIYSVWEEDRKPSELIKLYVNAAGTGYSYVDTSTGAVLDSEVKYDFSDGTTPYKPEDPIATKQSKEYVVFGRASSSISWKFTDLDIDYNSNRIILYGHGFHNGDVVVFTSTDTLPTGLDGNYHFIVGADDYSFQISKTPGGAAVDLTPYPKQKFWDRNVQYYLSVIRLGEYGGHGFSGITRVRFELGNDSTLPLEGITIGTAYYALPLDTNQIEIYTDRYLQERVDFALHLPGAYLSDANFVDAQNYIQCDTAFYPGAQVRFLRYGGSLPPELNVDDVYRLNPIANDQYRIFARSDVGMTTPIDFGASSGVKCYMVTDGSKNTMIKDDGEITVEKQIYKEIHYVRYRRINPCLPSLIKVTVGDKAAVRGTDYRLRDESLAIISGDTKEAHYISFDLKIGVDPTLKVGVTCGDDTTPWFVRGIESNPTCGAYYQGRLALAGFTHDPSLVLLSRVGEYNFMQIDDELEGIATDPQELRIENYLVKALESWQDSLFIFTPYSTYRSTGDYKVSRLAAQGAVGSNATCITDTELLFLSENSVYRVGQPDDGSFTSLEVGTKIRPDIANATEKSWLGYDPHEFKVFLGWEHKRLFVWFNNIRAWSEYGDMSVAYHGFPYIDNTTGQQFAICVSYPCEDVYLLMDVDGMCYDEVNFNVFQVEDVVNSSTLELKYAVTPVDTIHDIRVFLDGVEVFDWSKRDQWTLEFDTSITGKVTVLPSFYDLSDVVLSDPCYVPVDVAVTALSWSATSVEFNTYAQLTCEVTNLTGYFVDDGVVTFSGAPFDSTVSFTAGSFVGREWHIPLAPRQVATAVLSYVITENRSVTATITAANDINLSNNSKTASIGVIIIQPDVRVTASFSNPIPNQGQTSIYSVGVSSADAASTNVEVTLTGATNAVQSHHASVGTLSGNVWTIGNMARNTSATLDITYVVMSANTVTATATLNEPDTNPANNTASATATPVLPHSGISASIENDSYGNSVRQMDITSDNESSLSYWRLKIRNTGVVSTSSAPYGIELQFYGDNFNIEGGTLEGLIHSGWSYLYDYGTNYDLVEGTDFTVSANKITLTYALGAGDVIYLTLGMRIGNYSSLLSPPLNTKILEGSTDYWQMPVTSWNYSVDVTTDDEWHNQVFRIHPYGDLDNFETAAGALTYPQLALDVDLFSTDGDDLSSTYTAVNDDFIHAVFVFQCLKAVTFNINYEYWSFHSLVSVKFFSDDSTVPAANYTATGSSFAYKVPIPSYESIVVIYKLQKGTPNAFRVKGSVEAAVPSIGYTYGVYLDGTDRPFRIS